MRRMCLFCALPIGLLLTALPRMSCAANHIELAGTTLEFSAPAKVKAYDNIPVSCTLTGTGDVIVQAVATDSAIQDKYFDTAVPHKVAYKFELISEDQNSASFKVTNTGDTIWKANGYGRTKLLENVKIGGYLDSDLPPGESVSRTLPVRVLVKESTGERRFVLQIERSDTSPLRHKPIPVEVSLADLKPGQSVTKEYVFDPEPLLDAQDEFGAAFARCRLDDKTSKVNLQVQAPPWADRLVVRLIANGEMKSVTVPIEVSKESLELEGKPNQRWTLNGKPVFILVNVETWEIPQVRQLFPHSDNIVLACRTTPDAGLIEAAKKYGFKLYPWHVLYVRLQRVAELTGQPLMQGAPEKFNIQRVDALDPNFYKAYADVIDRLYEGYKDVIYRTADGKVPMCLSGEQSYGYLFSAAYPTRWGGGTPEDVAAFRVWLREKYGSIAKLNEKWTTSYKDFEEVDPSQLRMIYPPEYPDPWKEWGPALEDFDVFRSKIHGEFWAKTVAEIKKRHPDILCGINVYGGYASETEPIYNAYYNWGVKDYQSKGVNWLHRRTGTLPNYFNCFDFYECWNSGSPDATRKNIEFWRKRGKEVISLLRDHRKVIRGGDDDLRSGADLGLGLKGVMVGQTTAYFPVFKTAYELGGVAGVLNDRAIGAAILDQQRREIELYNAEIARESGKGK